MNYFIQPNFLLNSTLDGQLPTSSFLKINKQFNFSLYNTINIFLWIISPLYFAASKLSVKQFVEIF